MRLPRNVFLCTSYLGLVLQLGGLSWDAVLHSLDPALASEEGVFTLTNPSHLLFVLGLGMVAGGLIAQLLRSAQASHGLRRRCGPLVASGLLLAVGTGATGVGLSTGGASLPHTHHHAEPGGMNHDDAIPTYLKPTLVGLQQVVSDAGTERALARLDDLASSDETVAKETHQLSHALGRFSLTYYKDAATAFQHCTAAFESGCYHGVLEAYFEQHDAVQPEQVAALCSKTVADSESRVLRFQCLHGLGHGLMTNLEYDLYRSLSYCDYLSGAWEQQSCYGGVFMENAMFEFNRRNTSDQAGHEHLAGTIRTVRPEDPLYPCDRVAEVYDSECYQMQSSVMLMLNGGDFQQTARTCETAPDQFVATCYESIGRDAAGYALRDPTKAAALCMVGSERYREFCFGGAAATLTNGSGSPADGFALCRLAPAASKEHCYGAVGEYVGSLYVDAGRRASACADVEEVYVSSCRRAAELDQSTRSG